MKIIDLSRDSILRYAPPVDRYPPPPAEREYVYRWDRKGRKGQACRVVAKGALNSCSVEFADGFVMVTSRNALKRRTPA